MLTNYLYWNIYEQNLYKLVGNLRSFLKIAKFKSDRINEILALKK